MRSLNFAPYICIIPLVQSWWQCGSDLTTQSLILFVLNICAYIFHHLSGYFLLALEIIQGHLVFLLFGKAVVLSIKITFKRIDTTILKLALSCLKNIVVWSTMLSRELTNPDSTNIAFGTIRTYSHWRRTPNDTRSAGRAAVLAPHLSTACFWVKTLFVTVLFRD